jgi:hypothetical protein
MFCTHLNTSSRATITRLACAVAALAALPACGGGHDVNQQRAQTQTQTQAQAQAPMQTQKQTQTQTQMVTPPSLRPSPPCDWLRTADSLAVTLSYDTAPARSPAAARGQWHGKLLRLPNPPNGTRFGTWLSDSASLQEPGVTSHDLSDKLSNHTHAAPGNALALRVDFESCTYTLGANVKLQGAPAAWRGALPQGQQPWRRVATFAATDLPLLQAGEITAALSAQAVRNINDTAAGPARWVPAGPPEAWRTTGPAQVRWHVVSATKPTPM